MFRFFFIAVILFLQSFKFSYAYSDVDNKKVEKAKQRLKGWVDNWRKKEKTFVGYPVNQEPNLMEFYQWYLNNHLPEISLNNVGNPMAKDSGISLNSHEFEKEVIDYFAPIYGFRNNDYWGFVSDSGTDGNNHGIYFGRKNLQKKSTLDPIIYVSEEAHYSIKKLADVQNTELRLIKTDKMGAMDLKDFSFKLDIKRPALVVIALGTTFKGGIDDQKGILKILRTKAHPAYYIHLDAALFGGYLPFLDGEGRNLVNRNEMGFDSIAVSGHKFFGFDNPMGLFITTKKTFNNINPFRVEYLNEAIPTITCSRSGIASLKFWWKINTLKSEMFTKQASEIIKNAEYLEARLKKTGVGAWRNQFSNTVFFQRPAQNVVDKYDLATEVSSELGALAHVVVMQHVDKNVIDQFVVDISQPMHN